MALACGTHSRGSPVRRPSWGSVALRGHRAPGLGRSLVPPDPYGVHRPSGTQPEAVPPRRSEAVALRALSRPFRGLARAIRKVRARGRSLAPSPAASPGLCGPTARVNAVVCMKATLPAPPRATSGVWIPPSRLVTTRPRGRRSLSGPRAYRHHEGVGAPMGFLLQGFAPRSRLVLLSEPLPSCRFHAPKPTPEGGAKTHRRLQGVRSRVESVRTGWARDKSRATARRRSLLGVRVSPEHAPARNWLALWSRSLPSRPSAG